MRKNLIALAVSITLVSGALAAHAAVYTDASGNWAQNDIKQMTDLNIMAGFSDGLFHPDAWVTRTDYTKMVLKTLGLPYTQMSNVQSVEKVYRNDWGFGQVEPSMMTNYPQGVFCPENPVRRVEAIAALAGTLTKPMVSEAEASQILSRFSDAAQIPGNARRAVATAIKYNLYTIDPKLGSNNFYPLQPITRAEVAALLSDLYENRSITIAAAPNGVATSAVRASAGPSVNTDVNNEAINQPGVTTRRYSNDVAYRDAAQAWLYGSIPYRSGADNVSPLQPIPPGRAIPINPQITTLNLPPKTTFTGTVAKALYSEYNRPGDPVMLILDHNVVDSSNKVLAPAGSKLLGFISYLTPRNPNNGVAEMGMVFPQLVTPEGRRYNLTGVVASCGQDGVLRANEPEGIIFHPEHSVAALKREINTAQGGWYNTKQGKTWYLNEPYTTQVSNQPIVPADKTENNILIGVGDRLQVRVEGCPTCP
ncbi:MAG TPA: S-layer homology domain-containing protein [Oculatellaceae cyanobacterium]|jgi:hypothetical protein